MLLEIKFIINLYQNKNRFILNLSKDSGFLLHLFKGIFPIVSNINFDRDS